jgi:hypothetical protein
MSLEGDVPAEDTAAASITTKRKRVLEGVQQVHGGYEGLLFCDEDEIQHMEDEELDETETLVRETEQLIEGFKRIEQATRGKSRRSAAVLDLLSHEAGSRLAGPFRQGPGAGGATRAKEAPQAQAPTATSPWKTQKVGKVQLNMSAMQDHYQSRKHVVEINPDNIGALQILIGEQCPFDPEDYDSLSGKQRMSVQNWYLDKLQQVNSATRVSGGQNAPYFDNTPKTIKPFSGSDPPNTGELTHRRWKRAVISLIGDGSLKEEVKRRIVLRSIVGKAEDLIQGVINQSLNTIVGMIDCTYGRLQSAESRKAEFYAHKQEEGSAIDYFIDLYVEAQEITQEEGFEPRNTMKEVVTQFCRGVYDAEILLAKLDWESSVDAGDELDFQGMSAQLRREVQRMEERKRRQQPKQPSAFKPSSTSHKPPAARKMTGRHAGVLIEGEPTEESLEERLERLELVVTSQGESSEPVSIPHDDEYFYPDNIMSGQQQANPNRRLRNQGQNSPRIKPFCYRCGLEDHMCDSCDKDKNPTLVAKKRAERNAAYEKLKSRQQKSLN